MPLYEYECPGCGQTFEKRVTMAEADQITCLECGNQHPRRLLARINLKGQTQPVKSSAPLPPGGG